MFTVVYRFSHEGWHSWSWFYLKACFAKQGFHTHQLRDTCYISDIHDLAKHVFYEPAVVPIHVMSCMPESVLEE